MGSSDSSEAREIATAELDSLIRGTEFFRSLVENSSDAIVTIDSNSTILYANESIERVLGYEPDELIGRPLTTMMPDRFNAKHLAAIERYLETGDRTIEWNGIELPAEHADGHEVPLSITFEEHIYEGGRVFSGIMRDVSDRVEREEKLERFASIVSHDLKDPLQTARAIASVARAGDEGALADLEDVFDRMEELIDDVLTLSKQGRAIGDTETVSVESAARDAWGTAGAPEATLLTDAELGTVTADPERLQAAFENLFRNAIDHVGEDVTVRVGPLKDAPGFFVSDDGPGFGDTDVDSVFDYGYTTSESNTGFGLSIVSDIVRAHDWSIDATTGTDGGARFEITTR